MKSNLKDWTRILGKTTDENSAANTAWHFSCRISWNDPQKLFFSATNSSGTNYWQENQHAENNSFKSATGGLLNLSYGSGSITRRVDGTQTDTGSVTGALKSLPNESVKLGKDYNINFSEFLIFNDKLSSTDELKVEGYLAHKWGLQGELPSGHAHKSNTPSFGGWAIERGPSGVDDLTLNLSGAGDKFTKPVPMNDNEWHHIATTFGGGNKKIYIDGQLVGTASQSGSVSNSTTPLILGEVTSLTSNAPRIDDVRLYGVALTAAEVAAIYNEGENDVGAPKFSVTSPATMQGAVGKSVSYQITTDAAYGMTGYNSAITYTLLNKPSWLSVNGSTGAVSGTPPSAGTYTFQAKATNTLGTGVKDVTLTVTDYANWNYALPFTTNYAGGSALKDWNMLVRLSEDSSNGAGNAGFRYSQANPTGETCALSPNRVRN